MPRGLRRKSTSGIYHVMIRGINKQIIFEEDADRSRFLATLNRFKSISNYTIYGYCLMDNHVHLLVRESEEESLSKAIQRISSSFVRWYNDKHERTRHLFQGRFRSEVILDERAFLSVLRYIHQNPLKAGITSNVFTSKWTSMSEYLYGSSLVSTELAFQLFSSDQHTAYHLFNEYMQEFNFRQYCSSCFIESITDADCIQLLHEMGITHISAFQSLEKQDRNEIITKLKETYCIPGRQISRITGIPKSTIYRI